MQNQFFFSGFVRNERLFQQTYYVKYFSEIKYIKITNADAYSQVNKQNSPHLRQIYLFFLIFNIYSLWLDGILLQAFFLFILTHALAMSGNVRVTRNVVCGDKTLARKFALLFAVCVLSDL